MKSDGTLSPILNTSIQPLTNSKWDDILPYSVKLVFTMVWNIVTWILYKRSTDANETHIYVAINQAADVLMTEKLKTIPQIEKYWPNISTKSARRMKMRYGKKLRGLRNTIH
ncbi:MAG: hypothetical protein HC831_29160 [Chloroflexia bacterium]|nr:hypothetical protein [Chloroflexia bacterium]